MRTKGVGPQGLGISKATPLKQTRKADESRNLSSKTKPRKEDPKVTAPSQEFVGGDLGIKHMEEEFKKNKKKYRDVVDYKGKSQLNKPVDLFFNPGTNRAHGMGGTMDRLVEGAKNIIIPGRYLNKVYKAYKYKNRSR
jgi:hypothetical protein